MPDYRAVFSQIDDMAGEIVELHRDLVRIPSVNTGRMPTGDETAVCEYVRDWLAEDGVESEILGRVPERGNVIARIEGRNAAARLMFMSHTDVVPVEEEDKWTFPPFSATIRDGRVYGRGASDCKGLLAAQMVAMRLLRRNGIALRDSLILCSGADEEHGGRYGFGWLAENHPEKITAPFAVNEGGGTPIEAAGGLTYLLGVGEKGRLQVEFEIKGVSAHASVPWQGTNALYRLSRLLERIENIRAGARHVDQPVRASVQLRNRTRAVRRERRRDNRRSVPRQPALRLHAHRPLAHDNHADHDKRRDKIQQRPGDAYG